MQIGEPQCAGVYSLGQEWLKTFAILLQDIRSREKAANNGLWNNDNGLGTKQKLGKRKSAESSGKTKEIKECVVMLEYLDYTLEKLYYIFLIIYSRKALHRVVVLPKSKCKVFNSLLVKAWGLQICNNPKRVWERRYYNQRCGLTGIDIAHFYRRCRAHKLELAALNFF